jgi:GLPGLI family protein
MHKIFIILVVSLLVNNLIAQIKEGHVGFNIETTATNPEMQMAIGMMQGSTLDVYFKEKATRGELKMGTVMTTTTLSDEVSGDVLILISGMMGNMAVKSKANDQEPVDSDSKLDSKVDVTITAETKLIQGYKCKKAVLTDEEGGVSTFWFTEDIDVFIKGQSAFSEDIPGFPMQFEFNKGGLIMTMTATKVETSLPKNSRELFKMTVPEGYKELTADELKQMGMSGM